MNEIAILTEEIRGLREEVRLLISRTGQQTLSQKEVCQRLGRSATTIQRLRNEGHLTALGPPTRPRYCAQEVARYERSLERS